MTGVNRRQFFAVATLLAISIAFGVSQSRAEVFSADAVKAAFLYRFASYVEWPGDAHPSPFVIAVADGEEVARQLELLLPRTSLNGQPAQVRRVARVADLDGVHILYIGPKALGRMRSLRAAAAQRPILLVTDDEDGIASGAIINFIEVSRKVRFEVSLVASDRARLKINSSLLSVAARVERRPQAWMPCAEAQAVDARSRHPRPGCSNRLASATAGVGP